MVRRRREGDRVFVVPTETSRGFQIDVLGIVAELNLLLFRSTARNCVAAS